MKKFYLCLSLALSLSFYSTAQCHMDRHGTSWQDSWISCNVSQGPNPDHSPSHWIMYDLGFVYDLGALIMWNANVPDSTARGVAHIIVDYSMDGTTWNLFDETDVPEASGSSTYEGTEILDFNGTSARYVLINATSNYGDACFAISEIKINIQSVVVPISLLSFTAECDRDEVLLQWQTEAEINNDYFEIQRKSQDSDWLAISRIESKQNINDHQKYSFRDGAAVTNQSSYYRLVQVDLDGARTVFDATVVECDSKQRDLSVFPNPAVDQIEVLYKNDQEGTVEVKIINSLGQLVEAYKLDVNQKRNLDITALVPGNYLLEIDQGTYRIVRKLVIIQ